MSREEKSQQVAEKYLKLLEIIKERYPQIIKEIGVGPRTKASTNTTTIPTTTKEQEDEVISKF